VPMQRKANAWWYTRPCDGRRGEKWKWDGLY